MAALSAATSLSPSQFYVIRSHLEATHTNSDSHSTVIEVALAPFMGQGQDTPEQTAAKLASSGSTSFASLQASLSPAKVESFTYVAIKKEQPKAARALSLFDITDHSITVAGAFYQPVLVHGVALADSSLACPLPAQIVAGLGFLNQPLPNNLISSSNATNGSFTLPFEGLSPDISYRFCVTAEELLPYSPRLMLPASETLALQSKTLVTLAGLSQAELEEALTKIGINSETRALIL